MPCPAPPGTILATDDKGIMVACGQDALLITELQKPGGKRLSAAAFWRGIPTFQAWRSTSPS
jgi:methionyl-tRNA formyltransferase